MPLKCFIEVKFFEIHSLTLFRGNEPYGKSLWAERLPVTSRSFCVILFVCLLLLLLFVLFFFLINSTSCIQILHLKHNLTKATTFLTWLRAYSRLFSFFFFLQAVIS